MVFVLAVLNRVYNFDRVFDKQGTVEPPVSAQPNAKTEWSLTRIEPQVSSSEKRSRHI